MIDSDEIFNKVSMDFEVHGHSAIDLLAKENPLSFLQIIAMLVCDVHKYVEVDGD